MKKGTAKHLQKIPGKQNLAEIQKIVLTSTAHILRKAIKISNQYKLQQNWAKKRVKFFMIF